MSPPPSPRGALVAVPATTPADSPLPAVLPAPRPSGPSPAVRRQHRDEHTPPGGRPRLARRALLAAAFALVLGHVAANVWSPYGVHRDELLYLAMGAHLRLWAMDFPPFIALAAQTTRVLFADLVVESVAALRAGPALAHGAVALLAGMIARELGGRRGAQCLAALAAGTSPLFLRAGSLFQPVVFDQLWWTVGLLALVRLGRAAEARPAVPVLAPQRRGERRSVLAGWGPGDARDWLLLGAAGGMGLLTKFSVAFFALGALAGVLATPLRRAFRTPAPWAAALVALAIGAPSVVGQVRLGWPVFGQMADLRSSQLARVGLWEFVSGQLLLGPALLLAGLGLWALLRPRDGAARNGRRDWDRGGAGRAAGVACVTAVLALLASRGKAYYAGPVYPALWAAGAVALAEWQPRRWLRSSRARVLAAALPLVAFGVATLPFGLPIVPPAAMARYAAGMGVGTETNTGGRLPLPQDYADMLGWPELAAATALAWRTLTPEQQISATLFAGNYGQAGALELYGPRVGLPPVVSAAGSWWFFGSGDRLADPIVTVGVRPDEPELRALCGRVRELARVRHDRTRWLVDEERDVRVLLCEAPRRSLHAVWPGLGGRN